MTAAQRATIVERLYAVKGEVDIVYPAELQVQAFTKQLQAALTGCGLDC